MIIYRVTPFYKEVQMEGREVTSSILFLLSKTKVYWYNYSYWIACVAFFARYKSLFLKQKIN